jgi:hypothetical protein
MKLSDWQAEEHDANLNKAEASEPIVSGPSVPIGGVWRTVRGYILWSYERGTIQYDVMVTLILLFVFLSPYWINFKDKPIEHNPHQIGLVVSPDDHGGFIYQIEGKAVHSTDDAGVRKELLSIIEPVSGEVSITKYEKIGDGAGHVLFYKVWAERE